MYRTSSSTSGSSSSTSGSSSSTLSSSAGGPNEQHRTRASLPLHKIIGSVSEETTLLRWPWTTGPVKYKVSETIVNRQQTAHLLAGAKAVALAKGLLAFGAGNTEYDIGVSGGRSKEALIWARSSGVARPLRLQSFREMVGVEAAKAVAARGGNCGEHAYVVAALLDALLEPGTIINIGLFEGLDHAFVVIGEIKENDLANKDLVIVDAWPAAGQPVLAPDFKFGEPKDLKSHLSFAAKGACDGNRMTSAELDQIVDGDAGARILADGKIDPDEAKVISELACKVRGPALVRPLSYEISPLIAEKVSKIISRSGLMVSVTPAPRRSQESFADKSHDWSDTHCTESEIGSDGEEYAIVLSYPAEDGSIVNPFVPPITPTEIKK